VFSVLISNLDDHLRNHGFLHVRGAGWRLCPVYDLNPVPLDVRPRVLSTAIDEQDTTASVALAFDVASYFGLSTDQAREIARQVARPIRQWRRVAASLGIEATEIERMSSAFEHEDLAAALK
jgi:serine/threonine-protein kinase HipA